MKDLGPFKVDMRPSEGPGDREIAELARRQRGVVAHWQLLRLGLSREAIQRRVRAGRLHRVEYAVYAVGHRALTWHGRCLSSVLSYGPYASSATARRSRRRSCVRVRAPSST